MRYYTLESVNNLINNYVNKNGEVLEVIEGVLGHGITICYGDGLKSSVIKEVFVNSWSSTHTIIMYNKLPKKYEKMIDKFYNK